MTTTTSPTVSRRRTLQGTVVRRSGDKTVAVQVSQVKVHPRYHKRSRQNKTYLAHDPKNEAQVGQTVTIREHRPLSARKRWLIISEPSQPVNSAQ